jgi:Tol biopolymer transport system component
MWARAIGAVVIIAAVIGLIWRMRRNQPEQTSFAQMTISPLTSTGNIHSASVSPDGKWMAYVQDDNGGHAIWVRQLATGSTAKVLSGTPGEIGGLTFTRDGNYLYYTKKDESVNVSTLYQIPSLGGSPREIIADVDSPISLSPDEKQFVFEREVTTGGQSSHLMVANADGSNPKDLVVLNPPAHFSQEGPAWSPDGKRIAVGETPDGNFAHYAIEMVDVSSGTGTPLGSHQWHYPRQIAWLPDGSGVVFPAQSGWSANAQMWGQSYPDGDARKITNDLNFYTGATVTSDGSALATVQLTIAGAIWTTNVGGAEGFSSPHQVTSGIGRADGSMGISWGAPKEILFGYYSGGAMRLASIAPDGTNLHDIPVSVTSAIVPDACGDGKRFVFVGGNTTDDFSLWVADVDGGNGKKLPPESSGVPACSPDGKFIVYDDDERGLMRTSIDGSSPTLITKAHVHEPQVSPDEALVAGFISLDASKPPQIAIVDIQSGEIRNTYDMPTEVVWQGDGGHKLEWTKDGRSVLYQVRKDEIPALWAQPVGPKGAPASPPKRIAVFPQETHLWGFTFSPDGTQIAYSRGQYVTDAVLISHFH